jgi:glycosyltransferase involved in cell wall biosynthesis
VKVLYLYPSPRREILECWSQGGGPDTLLLGLNHLRQYGIEAEFLDPAFFEGRNRPTPLQQLRAFFAQGGYDLLVAKDLTTGFLLSLLRKAGLFRRPLVYLDVVVHEETPLLGLLTSFLASSERVAVATSRLQEELRRWGVPGEKLVHIPWAVDYRFFAPLPRDQKGLLSVGSNDRDYETLFRAVKGLETPLRIATRREDLRPPPYATCSALDPLSLREAYARARFVVLPLHDVPSASGATALLEAMAMGRGVIVSASQGILDYVEDGKNALLVEPGDPGELRRAILYLLENPEVAERLGERGRRDVEERWNTQLQAERLAALYRECLTASPPKSPDEGIFPSDRRDP